MTTSRIYSNGKRVSTGKTWKDKFVQVYPAKKVFASYDEWVNTWSKILTITIQTETVVPAPVVAPVVPVVAPPEVKWSYTRQFTFTFPPGKYYVGDLCYALHDEVYDGVFGGQCYEGGLYQKGSSIFLVDGTSCGDGTYFDDHGRQYLVDAGIIGICSWDLTNEKYPSIKGGQIMTFEYPMHCNFKEGTFNFDDFNGNGFTILT